MNHPPAVSGVLLCYNDSFTIEQMVARLRAALRDVTPDFEIIVVNDGSTDRSAAVLDKLDVRVVTHQSNRGYGCAVRSGFAAAQGDLVFYTDGDGQYDPQAVRTLYAAWSPEVDVVQGFKVKRCDPWYRRLLGTIYGTQMRRLFSLTVCDVNCDCRLVRRSLWNSLGLEQRGGAIGLEFLVRCTQSGARIVEVPVEHYPRVYGRSQFFRIANLLALAASIVRLWCAACSGVQRGRSSFGGRERILYER